LKVGKRVLCWTAPWTEASARAHGTELLLEPSDNPATKAFTRALSEQGIPLMSFAVEDIKRNTREFGS
jgi:hypothetical protein